MINGIIGLLILIADIWAIVNVAQSRDQRRDPAGGDDAPDRYGDCRG